MAESLVFTALEKLMSLYQNEVELLDFISHEKDNLARNLELIVAVLKDAELKELTTDSEGLKIWFHHLKDAVHVLEEILNDCSYQAFRDKFDGDKSCVFLSFVYPENFMFRHDISRRMKAIRERLDRTAQDRVNFGLNITAGDTQVHEIPEWRETTSTVKEVHVYGRDQDKDEIVKLLLGADAAGHSTDSILVYPIVGMGGIGKTTLAQFVFNDPEMSKHFDLKMWVCVSDNFELKVIMRDIIESASGKACKSSGKLDLLERELRETLQAKKYLLVLDDVWSDNQGEWDKLKHVLSCGSKGSSALVTTRKGTVASIMGTPNIRPHRLTGLSNQDCSSLFNNHAFPDGRNPPENLVVVGERIVEKCGGVPLAAKALGSLLRLKTDEPLWIEVEKSEIWNLSQGEDSIIAALRLSYMDLSAVVRRCFAYCAIFPKNHVIETEGLVNLWIANGLISCDGMRELEDMGNSIVEELYARCLLQNVERDGVITQCGMHNLVHDLAQFVMREECHALDTTESKQLPSRLRHLSFTRRSSLRYSAALLSDVESLQTIIYLWEGEHPLKFDLRSLLKHNSLKALDLSRLNLTELPFSISILKHLRYLNLAHTGIRTLPTSICHLWNLQVLILDGCESLERLPKHMARLINLRRLGIRHCKRLYFMPSNMSRLTSLRLLSLFIVGEEIGCSVSELGPLKHLRGRLKIQHLERVRDAKQAHRADLVNKKNLDTLVLSWKGSTSNGDNNDQHKQTLEALRPPQNLKELKIVCYQSPSFPGWMTHEIAGFKYIHSVELYNCTNCLQLPPLWKLAYLKNLTLRAVENLEYIIDEDAHENNDNGDGSLDSLACFSSLEVLEINSLPKLKRMSTSTSGEETTIFPRLSELYISVCPKLTSFPPLPSLRTLAVDDMVALRSISNADALQNLKYLILLSINLSSHFPEDAILKSLNSLEKLMILACHEIESIPDEMFEGLHSLRELFVCNCSKLKSWFGSLKDLTSLEELSIIDCPELVDFPSGFESLTCLEGIFMDGGVSVPSSAISSTSKLENLPEAIRQIPYLKRLTVGGYPNITSLPEWLGDMGSLEYLNISGCPNVVSLPDSITKLPRLKLLSPLSS